MVDVRTTVGTTVLGSVYCVQSVALSLHETGRFLSPESFWESVDHGGHLIVFGGLVEAREKQGC
jgi:hypothetical protein